MDRFEDIIGQDAIRDHLKEALLTGKVSHAYILDGAKDSGRHFISEIFTAALLCKDPKVENGTPKACGKCESCIKMAAKSHPDVIYVHREEKNGKLPSALGVDEIRRMRSDVAIRPYESERKVYIIEEAELMNQQAQNALLKTIEEPPAYAVIFLLADGTASFLPTILSRCITLRMKEVPEDTISKFLVEKKGIAPARASILSAFAGGNLGRAIRLSEDESFDEERRKAQEVLVHMGDMSYAELVKFAEEEAPENFVEYLSLWFKDVLVLKAGGGIEKLVFSENGNALGKVAAKISYEKIESILRALEEYRKSRSMVSDKTALTVLLVQVGSDLRE